MTLKQTIDEAMDTKTIQAQIQALGQTIGNFNKKIAANPNLAKEFSQDTQMLGQQSAGLNKSFAELVQQQLQQQAQKQQVQTTQTTAQTASPTAIPSQSVASGISGNVAAANG